MYTKTGFKLVDIDQSLNKFTQTNFLDHFKI